MRTPVVLVTGQGARADVIEVLRHGPRTVGVEYAVDGHVVIRRVSWMRDGRTMITEAPLEVSGCCISSTVRDDLLILLRQLHRRTDVARIVVALMEWLEPEPFCTAITETPVRPGPGFIDGPASRDVTIEAVVTCIDSGVWLHQALGDDDLDASRTVAQVVVGQAAFADVLVLTHAERTTCAVLRRLAPRARITSGVAHLTTALANLDPGARRGHPDDPHDALLAGLPPLHPDGEVSLLEFNARGPFHPGRLHEAIDTLLDGVVQVRGRGWLAGQPDVVLWIESAGGGLGVGHAGRWLAAMDAAERAYLAPERTALAAAHWDERFGDRHIALTALLCGADPAAVTAALQRALLTAAELDRPQDWAGYPDPFGDWHEDPCGAVEADTDPDKETAREA